ncbi:AEC family transporter [Pelobacter seleniigenes]|uniref:AEC family transporter n=1 Tax=Pelobacter seleniigenes TaxID=407188 RepID=UPI0004A728C4|nr:AEC family transporter [Pelobacter seleniigenes]
MPLLLIPLSGFFTVKHGLSSRADGDSIGKITFSFLIPALLFANMAQMKIPAKMNWNCLSAYDLDVFTIYLLSIRLSCFLFDFSVAEQSVFGMASSNATIVGMPVGINADIFSQNIYALCCRGEYGDCHE